MPVWRGMGGLTGLSMSPAGYFLSPAKESNQRTPQETDGFLTFFPADKEVFGRTVPKCRIASALAPLPLIV